MTGQTYVVIGGGLAGAKAVETLREERFEGQVVLLAGEKRLPYERPPLSKEFLLDKDPADKATVHDEGWYAAHDVELRPVGRRGRRPGSRPSRPRPRALRQAAAHDRSRPRKLKIPGSDERRSTICGPRQQ